VAPARRGALPAHAADGKQVFRADSAVDRLIDDAAMREIGEWEVRGDGRVETRFHFRTGITSVVPWLVVSASSSPTASNLGAGSLPLG
jgi:hypothetical protein